MTDSELCARIENDRLDIYLKGDNPDMEHCCDCCKEFPKENLTKIEDGFICSNCQN